MVRHLPSFHWAWLILVICFLDVFINYAARNGFGVVLPEMITEIGFGRTEGGSIYNAYFVTYITLAPLTGYLTDRIGARKVITACLVILGTGLVLMGTVKSFTPALFFFALVGIGATGMWTPVITVVQQWFAANRRGLALGILSSGAGLGFATMGIVFPSIVATFNWQYAWYFLGGGAFMMVFVSGLLLRSTPESTGTTPWGVTDNETFEPDQDSVQLDVKNIAGVLRKRTFWLIGISYFSISFALYGLATFMVDYARSQLMLPLDEASFLATVHGVCQVAGVLTIAPLSDHLGRRNTLLLSNMCITGALCTIVFYSSHPSMLVVLVGIAALFHGATFPVYGACAGDYFPRTLMGTVIGMWTPFHGLGVMAAHWTGGILRDTTGVYDTAFLINAVMAGVAFVIMCAVRQNTRRQLTKKPGGIPPGYHKAPITGNL